MLIVSAHCVPANYEENGDEEDEISNFFDFLQVLSEGHDWHVMKQVSVILFTWFELTKEWTLENLWSKKLKSLSSNYLASFIASRDSWQSIIVNKYISLGFKGFWTFGVKPNVLAYHFLLVCYGCHFFVRMPTSLETQSGMVTFVPKCFLKLLHWVSQFGA